MFPVSSPLVFVCAAALRTTACTAIVRLAASAVVIRDTKETIAQHVRTVEQTEKQTRGSERTDKS